MLVTTALTLIHDLELYTGLGSNQSIVSYAILGLGLLILLLNFHHLWPKVVAFRLSSATPVYILVYLTMALTYGNIPIDRNTVAASITFTVSLTIVFWSLQQLEATART
jgi:hypothetical protein